ncbi:tRNA pseudouridine(55) synthase TruB [Helcococcus kunzii]|uniref:tRNA pseudouridine(55) synthase TruB n=1 Tax=Helcococcus kunzii TaxID=40091 RepID=UPI001C950B83|nr:tRNA pseudouridine(55) synthase TruB [Helcococcus kunzii]QZO77093.1 tRNA pseudouridine(55) synthase TruB [Helcococcus kunzii]
MKTGILVVNKSESLTSHDVVSILRRKLNIKRIGHTGTLDPMATGVLPICIGNSTRISSYIMEQGKSYIAELKFGTSTTTYDSTGDVVDKSDNTLFSEKQINDALASFKGEIEQYPPKYSAIKVDGKKLYEYARQGQDVEIKPRKIKIYDIKLISIKDETCVIEIDCSKGTYIRSLIHDLGLKLNSFAHMTDFVRNRVGKFYLKDALDISKIDEYNLSEIESRIIDMEDALYNLNKIDIKDDVFIRLINGQKLNINSLTFNGKYLENDDIIVSVNNKFIGIGKVKNNILKMEKVLCQE